MIFQPQNQFRSVVSRNSFNPDHHFINCPSMAHPLTGFLLSSNCRKQRQLRVFSTSLYSSPGEAGKDHFCYVFRLFPLEILRLKRPLAFPHSPVVTACKFGLLRKYQNKNRFEKAENGCIKIFSA